MNDRYPPGERRPHRVKDARQLVPGQQVRVFLKDGAHVGHVDGHEGSRFLFAIAGERLKRVDPARTKTEAW